MTSTTGSADRSAAGRAAFVSPETLTLELPGGLELELGGRLERVQVAYRTWGALAADGGNGVVVCHALTGSADADQWWARMFGPGRALDPERDFIVCANILGSCYGTTGPTSIDPATGRPYLGAFPAVTVRDMVRVQRALVDALGVRRVRMAIGGSLGGMQVLEWALLYPELVESVVFIASTARHSAWCIGLSEAQRQAIYADPRWRDGAYDPADPPAAGLAAARMMAMLSYRSQPSFEQRFARRPQTEDLFAIESYLRYQGRLLVDRFDPATYVTLTRAMDTHDVSRARGDFDDVLRSLRQPTLVVSIDSDVLYWPWEQREVASLLPNARLAMLDSPHGHDAFLIDVDRLSEMVAEFRGERRRVAGAAVEGEAPIDRAYAEHGVSLLVLGKGKVGAELLEQLRAQRTELELDYETVLRVVGIADRRGALVRAEGVDLERWRELLAAAPASGPVVPASAPALLDRLAGMPRPVLVDLTAAEGMEEVYEQAFRRGIDVVAANKRPLAAPPRRREQLREARRHHGRQYRYDTAVGASLPVIGTLRRLVRSGDRIRSIVGSLSGTLGYLCTELGRGVPLSLATRWAIGLGYAEEDPRDDLSGLDAARKALILAREMGAQLALEDVSVEPLVPGEALVPGRPEALIAALRAHDDALAARVERLRGEGKVLRYLARLQTGPDGRVSARVGPEAVELADPAARLVGVEAYVAFTTARHAERPLIVQGAGVGGASTAGGILAEILSIAGGGEAG
ncbi:MULTISPECIES: homoserine O-acetyltransferase [Anaeromyxobacter]|uniref:homoserine O-acetyltransferase MetX n=1 Tax=Anaeromyxobacter TaxID=161492 RepID=UPI001F587044|nr:MULTISPECIES: homoserine O-acetyltransferase [unclassified Anaeromyxobacter]